MFNPFFLKESHEIMSATNCDIIHCELLWSAPAGILIKKKFKKPLILVDHNVESLKFKELNKFLYSNSISIIERICCKQADKIVVVSEEDKNNLLRLYGINKEKIHVIPNCADSEIFKYSDVGRNLVRQIYDIKSETIVLTFVGNLNYIPNLMAVKHIVERIYPKIIKQHPNSKFLIVGGGHEMLQKYENKNIIFTGYVKNLRDYLSASDIVLAPIDFGSGTRLKTVEAASCSRPIVTTRKGVEGQDFVDKKEIVITEKVDQKFIEGILELIEDERLRYYIGANARRKVESHYDWKGQIKKFEELYNVL